MSGLPRALVTAALGLSFAVMLYAADAQTSAANARTTQPYRGDYRAALGKCNSLPETGRAKCIVNIRPTETLRASPSDAASSDSNTVKDGSAQKDAEYAAAVRECEAVSAADRPRCVDNAKEHFGRM
jgi:hypothetical protein